MEIKPLEEEHIKIISSTEGILEHSDIMLANLISSEYVGAEGIFLKGEPVGIVNVKQTPLGIRINLMYLIPEVRGKGLGLSALKWLERKYPYHIIYCSPFTNEAERFYLRNGFKIDEDFDIADTNTVVKHPKVRPLAFV